MISGILVVKSHQWRYRISMYSVCNFFREASTLVRRDLALLPPKAE